MRRTNRLMRPLLCIGILFLAGCQLTSGRIIPSPLTYSEQEKEILAIAPRGTDRDEAVRKLNAAGLKGDFGSTRSIYYCDEWHRDSGERWHMNVALLFDKEGKLYTTQVSQAETGTVTGQEAAAAETTAAEPTGSQNAQPRVSTTSSSEKFKVGREATGARR
ncbi:MAG: hypothetical protein AB7O26_14785 [Planctomycetaceae bacterium]